MALRWAGIGSPLKIGPLKPASSSSSAHRADHIPIEADRAFRIVTAHSGPGRKSVNLEQNPRSASSRITGQVRSESAVNLVRNTHEPTPCHHVAQGNTTESDRSAAGAPLLVSKSVAFRRKRSSEGY